MKKQMLAERYQLERKLGQNAGRQTWLAQDISLSPPQPVVVKLLAFNPQMHWDELKLFEREAQVLQHLNHPRIPEYRDFFTIEKQFGEGLPWFALVQDYITGDSLQTLLDQGKRFAEAEVCQIAESILEILIDLHELSPPVFHRDIKPSNLILSQDQQIYLVDFGAVQDRATAEGVTFTVVGTSGYTPPEQLWGKVVPASDLYALGATLIHLLTGIAPADLPQHQMRLQFSDYINLTPHFAQWLECLTEPAPERRFMGARQALSTLKSGGDSVKKLGQSGVRYDHQDGLTFRDRVRYGRLAGLTFLQFIVASIAISLIVPNFLYTQKTPEPDAKDYVNSMNRSQQAYYLKHSVFADSLSQLNRSIPHQTKNYRYSTHNQGAFAFSYAISRKPNRKSYVGGVFRIPTTDLNIHETPGTMTTRKILCKANISGTTKPPEPTYSPGKLTCSRGTQRVYR